MIKANEIEIVKINTLTPHPKNTNRHSIEQIERLAKIIEYQGMRNPVIVQKGTNLVVAGHGRIEAMKLLGWEETPVIYQEFESEAQLYAYLVSDNEIARWAEFDTGLHLENIKEFELDDFDYELFGIENFNIPPINEIEENKIKDDEKESWKLQVTLLNEMEFHDLKDDLIFKGYMVKEL